MAEGTTLLTWQGVKPLAGSNPALSANRRSLTGASFDLSIAGSYVFDFFGYEWYFAWSKFGLGGSMSEVKPVSTIRGLGMILAMIVLIFAPVLAYTYHKNQPPPADRELSREERSPNVGFSPRDERRAVYEHIQSFDHFIFSRHPWSPSDFWLTGDEDPAGVVAKTEAYRVRVIDLLGRAREVSPLARRIVTEPVDVRIGLLNQGAPIDIVGAGGVGNVEEYLRRIEAVPGIVFVPFNEVVAGGNRFPSPLYYTSDLGAVSMYALRAPDAILAALLIHEFGHRLRHVEHAPSSSARQNTNLWIAEEVEMHELEHEVLDFFSEGRLSALYESIRQRSSDPTNVAEVVLMVGEEDILAFERMFELEGIGGDIVNLSMA